MKTVTIAGLAASHGAEWLSHHYASMRARMLEAILADLKRVVPRPDETDLEEPERLKIP